MRICLSLVDHWLDRTSLCGRVRSPSDSRVESSDPHVEVSTADAAVAELPSEVLGPQCCQVRATSGQKACEASCDAVPVNKLTDTLDKMNSTLMQLMADRK